MIGDHRIGVVVPAYNEELLVGRVVGTMPDFVDVIVLVNDGSTDATGTEAKRADERGRVYLLTHQTNQGLGQSLIDGYRKAEELMCDVVAVMGGDAQMAPEDLERVVAPIVENRADYVKGNRLLRSDVVGRMPRHRLVGNSILTFLSKFAHGYWHSMDPQCGYTAISAYALQRIPLEQMVKGYGYNADILNMLNIADIRVAEVDVEPVYGDEVSYIRLRRYIPSVSALLLRLFFRRLVQKYVIADFHPLALLYLFSATLAVIVSPPLLARLIFLYWSEGVVPTTTLLLLSFSAMFALLSVLFAMWMDMEDNRRLWARSRTARKYAD